MKAREFNLEDGQLLLVRQAEPKDAAEVLAYLERVSVRWQILG